MCGIVAIISSKNVVPDMLDILDKTEYRGYDSAGVCAMNGVLSTRKSTGKVAMLRDKLKDDPIEGTIGIGHTRWATHGEKTEANAHPHLSNDNTISVVHNGTIENYLELKNELKALGFTFYSETDTEVVPNLIQRELQRNIPPSNGISPFAEAVVRACARLKGAYALAIMCSRHKDELVVVRHTSPVVIGFREGDIIVASGKLSLGGVATDVVKLEDSHMAVLYRNGDYTIRGINGKASLKHSREKLDVPESVFDKGRYDDFMEKEIFEQPEALFETLRGRIDRYSGDVHLGATVTEEVRTKLRSAPRFTVVACGTSLHSALLFKNILERMAKVPVVVEEASEYIYRDPVIFPGEVVIGISQSGETADTLQALDKARKAGAFLYSVTNVVGSRMADFVGVGTFLHIGPEIGVASTKAFTAQYVVMLLLAQRIAELRGVGNADRRRALALELLRMPDVMAETIASLGYMKDIARNLLTSKRFFFIGRDLGYALAREGALKLKEIAYINAEGYPAGELKHGPLALIEKGVPVIATIAADGLHDKVLNNVHEVAARGGYPILINTGSPSLVAGLPYKVIQLPEVSPELAPLIAVIPMQLLAYYMGKLQGFDVDKPRNLAKSVTVE
jgi:glucosamine--fructose-6-phosphate aminotransferase (isomerizing)